MAKLSIAACAALFLLSAIVASPLNRKHSTTVADPSNPKVTMEQIIDKLKEVKKVFKNTSSYVAKVITDQDQKNLTIKEIACRGVKALNLPNPDEYLVSLNRSLAFFSKGVDCRENSDEKYDLQSFFDELLSEFQIHYRELHKPSY